MFTLVGNSIKDLLQSDSSQKPFKLGFDDLKQSETGLEGVDTCCTSDS